MNFPVNTKELIEWVLTRGLPMVAVYWVLERPTITRWFNNAKTWFEIEMAVNISTVKRLVAMVLSLVLSVGVWSIYAGLGYATFPVGFEGWINLLISLGTIVFTGSQVLHIQALQKGERVDQ